MAAVHETEHLAKAPALSVVAPRPTEGVGGPKLLDRLREALRTRHYSRRTEQTYCHWGKRFIYFHHPKRRRRHNGPYLQGLWPSDRWGVCRNLAAHSCYEGTI